MSDHTVIVELPGTVATWVRDAVAQKREQLPEQSEHYDVEEIDETLAAGESRLNDAIDGLSVEAGLIELFDHGLSPAEAVDYYMVEHRGISQTAWAERRGVAQQAVSRNVAAAKDELDA